MHRTTFLQAHVAFAIFVASGTWRQSLMVLRRKVIISSEVHALQIIWFHSDAGPGLQLHLVSAALSDPLDDGNFLPVEFRPLN
jgi:hypothetical protein